MKLSSSFLLALILLVPLASQAQNGAGASSSPNDAVTLGRRLFQQHCSVCHTQATLTNPMYGPSLYRDTVEGREGAVRDLIGAGSNKMPGFRYSLAASEISAIVEYLRTVPKPAQHGSQKGAGPVD
jgi:mono/diheme cytochrome c family protein